MSRMSEQYARPPLPLSPSMMQACQDYSWPGNLRELNNFIKRYLILGDEKLAIQELQPRGDDAGANIDSAHTPGEPERRTKVGGPQRQGRSRGRSHPQALDQTNWNRKQAAALLQISYKALLYKIRQYGIAQTKSHKLTAGA